jgi:hypothetical protein
MIKMIEAKLSDFTIVSVQIAILAYAFPLTSPISLFPYFPISLSPYLLISLSPYVLTSQMLSYKYAL